MVVGASRFVHRVGGADHGPLKVQSGYLLIAPGFVNSGKVQAVGTLGNFHRDNVFMFYNIFYCTRSREILVMFQYHQPLIIIQHYLIHICGSCFKQMDFIVQTLNMSLALRHTIPSYSGAKKKN